MPKVGLDLATPEAQGRATCSQREAFIQALHDDFDKHGVETIQKVRTEEARRLRQGDRLAAAERVQDRNRERPHR